MKHDNRCMMESRAAQGRLRNCTETYGVVLESVRAIQVASSQVVSLYSRELWWNPKELGRRAGLQHLLNHQAKSVLGALPMTPRGALLRESGLTQMPEMLDSRQQQFAVMLANACSSKPKEVQDDPSCGIPIFRVVMIEHCDSRTTQGMSWPARGKDPVFKTVILDHERTVKRAAQSWAREKEEIFWAGVSM